MKLKSSSFGLFLCLISSSLICGCAQPKSLLGVTGGSGRNKMVNGYTKEQLIDKAQQLLIENGCNPTEIDKESDPAVIFCEGDKVGNAKFTVEEFSPTSSKIRLWVSMPGMYMDSDENSYIKNIMGKIY